MKLSARCDQHLAPEVFIACTRKVERSESVILMRNKAICFVNRKNITGNRKILLFSVSLKVSRACSSV